MDLPALLGPERLRTYPLIVVAVAALAWGAWLVAGRDGLDPAGHPIGADYVALHAAGRLVADGRAAAVYDEDALQAEVRAVIPTTEAVLPVHYPPPALLVFAAPVRLPFGLAFAMWTVGTLGALVALFGLLKSGPLGWRWGLAYPGSMLVLFNGQTSAWVAVAACGGVALAARSPLLGGLLVGLAVVKPNYLALPLVALAVGGKWRALFGAIASAAALCALSAGVLGTSAWSAWIEHLPAVSDLLTGDRLQVEKMPTVTASLAVWGVASGPSAVVQAVAGLLAVSAVVVASRRGPDQALAAVAFGTFLFTPFAFDYDLVVAWAGLYVLARRWTLEGTGTTARWVLLAAGFVLPFALPVLAAAWLPLAPLLLGVLLFQGLSAPVDPPRPG